MEKTKKRLGMSQMHKIYVDTSLTFTTINYIQIDYKKLQFTKTYTNRSYPAPFIVERNVSEYEDAALNHSCINCTTVITSQPPPVAAAVSSSVASTHLECWVALIIPA